MNKKQRDLQAQERKKRVKEIKSCRRRKDGTVVCPPKTCYGFGYNLTQMEGYDSHDK